MDFHEKIETKISNKEIDESRLGWSFTRILRELVEE